MRIGDKQHADTRRPRPPPRQAHGGGAARLTASLTARVADQTENLTRKDKPHEPRGTGQSSHDPPCQRQRPPPQDTETAGKQTDKTNRPTGAERSQENGTASNRPNNGTRERSIASRPAARQARRGERTSGRDDQRNDQRRMPHGADTTGNDARGQARRGGRQRDTTTDDETEPR